MDALPPRPADSASPLRWLRDHEGWLRTLARARLQNDDLVDEVLQSVALAAVQAERQLVPIANVMPWLYRVLVRHCLLCRRKLGRQRKLVARLELQHQAAASVTQPDGLDWLLMGERQTALQAAMQRLTEQDRELLSLKYLEGWSYAQMASALGVQAGTIESRLHRARQKLRRELSRGALGRDTEPQP